MPRDALAVYVPMSRQMHEVRMLVNDEAMLAFQDFTATVRVQYTSDQHTTYLLPDWVSHVALLLPGGKEIPLPDGYTANFEKVFMKVGRQPEGKGSLGNAFTQIAAHCVSALTSIPSDSFLMVPYRESSTLGRLNTI